MILQPYKTLLTMSKEKLDETLAVTRAKTAQKQAELAMARIDEEISTLETAVTERCSSKNLDFDSIIACLDDIQLAERRKEQFQVILTQMFPNA